MMQEWTGWWALRSVLVALSLMAGAAHGQQDPRLPASPYLQGPPPVVPAGPARAGQPGAGRTASWPGGPPGAERMSPEERRQLRNDINEHGQRIYRDRRGAR